MSSEVAKCCALFEMVETNFGKAHLLSNHQGYVICKLFTDRKIANNECPHTLYIQNYSSAASSCIILRTWIFDKKAEYDLCERNPIFKKYCFSQVSVYFKAVLTRLYLSP